jgi:hypothetical protein
LACVRSKQNHRFEAAANTAKATTAKHLAMSRDLGEKTVEQLMAIGRRSSSFFQASNSHTQEVL